MTKSRALASGRLSPNMVSLNAASALAYLLPCWNRRCRPAPLYRQVARFVVGPCAVGEVSERLIERLGRRNVYLSRYCNDLCAVTEALFHLMKVKPTDLTYLGPLRSAYPYLVARLKGSSSRVPHLLSHVIKRV